MKRWRPILLNLCFSILGCFCASAQKPIGIAYYDVDHLYDTISSPFYNDDNYTPGGRYGWNTERYRRKIVNTAAVIDSMALPIVGLWSVENEAVVRDIATACKGGYTYLHRTLNSFDGMDFALLYFGDQFFPTYVEQGRRYLYVEGELRGKRIGLALCSDTRTAEWLVSDLREERPKVPLLIMGRTTSLKPETLGLSDTHARAARQGRGNIRRNSGWEMRDRILVDTALNAIRGDVFIRRFLIDEHTAYPIKTYDNKRYRGGYGYALPIYVYIE